MVPEITEHVLVRQEGKVLTVFFEEDLNKVGHKIRMRTLGVFGIEQGEATMVSLVRIRP